MEVNRWYAGVRQATRMGRETFRMSWRLLAWNSAFAGAVWGKP